MVRIYRSATKLYENVIDFHGFVDDTDFSQQTLASVNEMATQHVRLDESVHKALADHAEQTGGKVSGYASVAVAQWLKKQGVTVNFPNQRKSAKAKAAA